LEKSRGRRYATAQALADDLGDWLEDRPPRGLPGVVGRALRPTRRQALVAGVGLVGAATGVVVYRRQPDVILASMQSDLRKGKSVVLVGDKGRPRWFQWVSGQSEGKLDTTNDGFCSIHAGDDGALVELVPDPQSDSYRLELQVRHDSADIRERSEVGVFVARQGHPVGDAVAQFFVQFSANDILTAADR
jgi:serine/threonine-protein kinase